MDKEDEILDKLEFSQNLGDETANLSKGMRTSLQIR